MQLHERTQLRLVIWLEWHIQNGTTGEPGHSMIPLGEDNLETPSHSGPSWHASGVEIQPRTWNTTAWVASAARVTGESSRILRYRQTEISFCQLKRFPYVQAV